MPKRIFQLSLHPQTLDSVAQLVEQYTFNVWALGSNPSGITLMKARSIGWCFFRFRPNLSVFLIEILLIITFAKVRQERKKCLANGVRRAFIHCTSVTWELKSQRNHSDESTIHRMVLFSFQAESERFLIEILLIHKVAQVRSEGKKYLANEVSRAFIHCTSVTWELKSQRNHSDESPFSNLNVSLYQVKLK